MLFRGFEDLSAQHARQDTVKYAVHDEIGVQSKKALSECHYALLRLSHNSIPGCRGTDLSAQRWSMCRHLGA